MNYSDNGLAFYMLNSEDMKGLLLAVQSMDRLGRKRLSPRDRLQLELNLNNENGNPEEIADLLTEQPRSIMKRIGNACLYLVDNHNSDIKTERFYVQKLGPDRYWLRFPRTSYEIPCVLEKELRKVIYAPISIHSNKIVHVSGRLNAYKGTSIASEDSENPLKAQLTPEEMESLQSGEIPESGNAARKLAVVKSVAGKGDNDKLNQAEVSALLGAADPASTYARLTKRVKEHRNELDRNQMEREAERERWAKQAPSESF